MNDIHLNMNHYSNFDIDQEPIRALQRCSCCVLPETMPFIEFDESGVCNYCNTYKRFELEDIAVLNAWASKLRRKGNQPDSIVAFSGGRDSSFGMHYFVKELGLHPMAYCYDWGMVTDVAKANQKRMCEILGVELVTISANIAMKRNNIRKNILAWLKKPNLGMVPLFMAGDKQYFYFANKIRKEYKLDDILLANNPFERTHFKSGFCGVMPAVLRSGQQSKDIEKLPLPGVVRMAAHYAKQYLTNLYYINTSMIDLVGSAASAYMIPHQYVRLFDFITWDEEEIDRVLLGDYDWEKATDTESTWRIGDGTAPFYNYIYFLIAGFTENDTMRSNQIREGMLTREKALDLVYRDNTPRFESLEWYFDVVGLDMKEVLKQINHIPRMYETRG